MRLLVLSAIMMLLCSKSTLADDFPKYLVCQAVNTETIITSSWFLMGEAKVKSLYKFKDGNLYISSTVEEEKLHGKVTRMIGLGTKYRSEYKTFVFSHGYSKATVVDQGPSRNSIISIAKLQCTKI